MEKYPERVKLSWKTVRTVCYIIYWLVVLELIKHRVSLPVLLKVFEPSLRRTRKEKDVRHFIHTLDALLGRLYRADFCFQRSLILFRYLRSARYPVRIHYGVTYKHNQLRGHAWLTVDGKYLLERTDPRSVYTVIYTYPLHTPKHSEVHYEYVLETYHQAQRASA